MNNQVYARIDHMDLRPDGGVNVFFKVRLGDYLINVPLTLDGAATLPPEVVEQRAFSRLNELARELVEKTAQ